MDKGKKVELERKLEEHKQHIQRIVDMLDTGKLTKPEAQRLMGEAVRISKEFNRLFSEIVDWAEGKPTEQEHDGEEN